MNIAIVTGASSGMGKDFARILSEKEKLDEIWLVARRADRLKELSDELNVPCRIIPLDLKKVSSASELGELIARSEAKVTFLVNAAGYGQAGYFCDIDEDIQLGMIDLNCRALTAVTQEVIPHMARDSHIVMFSSAASFMAQPKFAVYAATKAYVQSLSRALNRELRDKKIHVTAVCPGPVRTEFFKIAEKTGKMAISKEPFMTDSMSVVEGSYSAAKRNAEMYTPTLSMKAARFLTKVFPRSLIIRFFK